MSLAVNPVVSVVVPLFNKRDYVLRAVSSVLKQTYKEFDLWVVDDGSTDQSPDVLRTVSDTRLHLVLAPHGGVSRARNRGIRESTGTFIAFLDADDEWAPTFLEHALHGFMSFPSAAAAFGNYRFGATHALRLPAMNGLPCLLGDYFSFALKHGGEAMTSSTTIVRRSRLVALGAFKDGLSYYEDQDLWGRLALSEAIVYVPQALATYHTEALGRTMANRRDAVCYPQFLHSYRQSLRGGLVSHRVRRSAATYAAFVLDRHLQMLLESARWREALTLVWREWQIPPAHRASLLIRLLRTVAPEPLRDVARRIRDVTH